jgi:protein-S-isoprenylcysteine O-methyltransferase Ste14
MGTFILILASIIWGAVHSVLASHGAKDAARRSLGAGFMRWYRLLYNGFSLVTFLPLIMLTALLPDRLLYTIPEPWIYLTLTIQAAAALCLLVAVLQTDVWTFAGLSQPFRGEGGAGQLVTTGMYRLVRHPLYTTGLVILWLAPQMTVNRLVLIICLSLYIFIGAYFEERKLGRDFGPVYAEYKARTPMFLPGLKIRPPDSQAAGNS